MSLFKQYLESENEFSKMNDNRLLNTYRKNRDWINKKRQIVRKHIFNLIENSEEALKDVDNWSDSYKQRLTEIVKNHKGKNLEEKFKNYISYYKNIIGTKNSDKLDNYIREEDNELVEKFKKIREEMNRRELQK